jgi:glycosyltransferase involved in cell wall biosynthesis
MKYKICILTTISLSIKSFYRGQFEALRQAGFEVTVICADDSELTGWLPEGVRFIPVSFSRVLSPFSDLAALLRLYPVFRKEKFSIIQYSTPKASLLGALAAFLANAPVRIYILWGLYYMGQKGFKYKLFKYIEKIICRLSHKILPISHEMVDFALNEGFGSKEKYEVMLNGSACGVDLDRFDPDKWKNSRPEIRDQFQIPENSVVIGTIARLTGDKGVNELVKAFNHISEQTPGVYLLLVGMQEEKDRLLPETEQIIHDNPRIRTTGWQDDPLPFYAAMDIFCLPTYREGFGEVNLEAQAMGLPVVSTDTIGPRESVENGTTGFLVEPKNTEVLIEPLTKLIHSPELRSRMGQLGRQRVMDKFDRRKMIEAIVQYRLTLLQQE